jgi:hypothetical protein
MGWVVRVLLIAGDLIASWFVARNAINFPIISLAAFLFLFACLVALLIFWPTLIRHFRNLTGIGKPK